MAKSELYFLGHTINLITVETNYNKKSHQYNPVLYNEGGLLRFVFDLEENFRFLERMTTIDYDLYKLGYPVDDGKIIFYDANDDNLKTWQFKDAPIVYYKVKFDANGGGMRVEMIISPAIQDYGCKLHRSWHITPLEEEVYQSPVVANKQEEKADLKFTAKFERLTTYKGEFGFDWMRENYKDICDNYEKLKKEYFPTLIHQEEYFVPTLSMFANQEGVKLKLAINKKEGIVSDNDIIKLPSKKGIRFEPNEIKVSEAHGKQITVFCDSPLSSDLLINLLDKNDKKVGVINIIKNNVNYNLNVKIVKVVRKESRERDLVGIIDALNQIDLNTYLNKKSLQQALINTTINDDTILELDGERLNNEEKLFGATFKEEAEKVSSMFLQKYIENYEKTSKHKGVLLFVTILQKPGSAGDGQLWIGNARNCTIFNSGLYQPSTYAHEIAHVLGCTHSFGIKEKMKDTMNEVKEAIAINKEKKLENESNVPKYEEKILKAKKGIIEMEKYHNNTNALANIKIHKENIISQKKNITILKKNIETLNNRIGIDEKRLNEFNHIANSNQHVFPTKGSTNENFMDYCSPSGRASFWKWQWKTMQEDIKLYYSK